MSVEIFGVGGSSAGSIAASTAASTAGLRRLSVDGGKTPRRKEFEQKIFGLLLSCPSSGSYTSTVLLRLRKRVVETMRAEQAKLQGDTAPPPSVVTAEVHQLADALFIDHAHVEAMRLRRN